MQRWLALLALAACHRDSGENLGLAAHRAIDLRRLAEPDELLRALGLPGREIDRHLGAHRLEASSSLTIAPPGKPVEKLEQTYRLDSDGAGALHLVRETSRGSGVEAVLAGGQLYVRPRWGRYAARRPEGDEVERLRALVEGVGAGTLGVLARWLAVRSTGRATLDGRQAVKLQLSARAEPLPAPADDAPTHTWREQLTVRALEGEAALDAASGAPLALTLQATYGFLRGDEKEPIVVTLEVRQNVAPAEPVVAPADAAPAPRRVRPMLDRQELLEGLHD